MNTSTTPREAVGRIILGEMGVARITRTDLAARVGLSRNTLGRKLDGNAPLTIDDLTAIAGALGINLVDIIRRAEALVAASGSAA